jgi:predicted homoserine dehydrogenase-like protein
MIPIDTLLRERQQDGRLIGMGLVGAGFMAHGLINQVINSTPRIQLVAVQPDAEQGVRGDHRGRGTPQGADSPAEIDCVASTGAVAVTDDIDVIMSSDRVEVIVDATGAVAFAAELALACFAAGKNLVLLNAEVDATFGPLLVTKADTVGLLYSGADGDQPAVQMNLYRLVRQIGLVPRVCGNIKRLQDPYRNPTTQEGFAERGSGPVDGHQLRHHYYGEAERSDVTHRDRLLPLGLAERTRLRRNVAKDEAIGYDDAEIPPGRLIDRLRAEQDERFFGSAAAPGRPALMGAPDL